MQIPEILRYLGRYRDEGRKAFVTSSFQSHSIALLHILSRAAPEIPVVFINTGYHFPETIGFRDRVTRLFELNLIDLRTSVDRSQQRDADGHFYFASNPDTCCFINKVQPLEAFCGAYDVWINGVRADQSVGRRSMRVEQPTPNGVIRFHPLLDWTAKLVYEYCREHDLPKHPLEDAGYPSVGCEPCTQRVDLAGGRDGRWSGMNKTECGLHTELVGR